MNVSEILELNVFHRPKTACISHNIKANCNSKNYCKGLSEILISAYVTDNSCLFKIPSILYQREDIFVYTLAGEKNIHIFKQLYYSQQRQ